MTAPLPILSGGGANPTNIQLLLLLLRAGWRC